MVSLKTKLVRVNWVAKPVFQQFSNIFPWNALEMEGGTENNSHTFFFSSIYSSAWSCCAVSEGVNISAPLNLTCLTPGDTSTSYLFFLNFQCKQTFSVFCLRKLSPHVCSSFLWVICCSSAWKWPRFSIAGHTEFAERFRMSISYPLYYNKITRQWNTLNSYLNKYGSVKNIYSPTTSPYEDGEL